MFQRKNSSILFVALSLVFAGLLLPSSAGAQHLRVRSARDLCNPDTVAIGKKAPDIITQEANGLTVPLSSLRGKYVLIQVWSSELHTCLKEMEAWKKMKEANKNRNVSFMDISVDKDINAWQLYYGQHNLQGIEVHADAMKPPLSYFLLQTKMKEGHSYFSYTLPQYILIDPMGTILDSHINMKPSDKASFAHFLDRLPGI